jgi:hypothetical protein
MSQVILAKEDPVSVRACAFGAPSPPQHLMRLARIATQLNFASVLTCLHAWDSIAEKLCPTGSKFGELQGFFLTGLTIEDLSHLDEGTLVGATQPGRQKL